MTSSTTIERALFVPRQLVWDAWTDPKQVTAWYPPDGAGAAAARIDARPGGDFDVSWSDSQGRRIGESGRVVAVAAPERLQLMLAGPELAESCVLILELVERDGAGAVRLTLESDAAPERGAGSEIDSQALWQARLERLERYFSVI